MNSIGFSVSQCLGVVILERFQACYLLLVVAGLPIVTSPIRLVLV